MASTSKPKVLCLHGWRTSANIMKMQMAAFRHHVDMDYQFVDAPFPAQGPPDSGIATFYPDQSYYEWYHKDDSEEEKKEQAIKFVFKLLVEDGPFDGLLGFSQGAGMVTRIVHRLQEEPQHAPLLQFVVLIGGVPPTELCDPADNNKVPSLCLQLPSLHIMGAMDPFLTLSRQLEQMYATVVKISPDGKIGNSSFLSVCSTALRAVRATVSDTLRQSSTPHAAVSVNPARDTGIGTGTDTSIDTSTSVSTTVASSSVVASLSYRVNMTHGEGHNIPSIRTQLYPAIKAWMVAHARRVY